MNINGVIVAEQEAVQPDNAPLSLSFRGLNLSAGIYFAVIRVGDEQVVKKVVVR
jgi:hypothetical protein